MIRAHKTRAICVIFFVVAIFLSVFSKTIRTITTATVQMEVTKDGTVRSAAICRNEELGYYVYHVEEHQTLFGEELRAVRNSVDVINIQDGLAYADGIYEGDRIIVASSRMLQDHNPIVLWDNSSAVKMTDISEFSDPSNQNTVTDLVIGLIKLIWGIIFIWILLRVEKRCVKKLHTPFVSYKVISIVIPVSIVTGLMLLLRFGLIGKNMFPAVWSDPDGWKEIYAKWNF